MRWTRLIPFGMLSLPLGAAAVGACDGSDQVLGKLSSGGQDGVAQGGGGTGGGGGESTGTFTGGDGGVDSNYPCTDCPAFPPAGTIACDASTLAAPTIAYPLDGLLLPPNLNVLEVQFTPPAGATLFEVVFENRVTRVRVETRCDAVTPVRGGASTGCAVTLPQGAWNDIADINRDGAPVSVTVRATADGSCVSTSTARIALNFAKEDVEGSIYFWQSAVHDRIDGRTGGLFRHDFGTTDPAPTPFYTSGATGTCVGCHFLSRDGARMSFSTDDPDGDDDFKDMKTHVLDVATKTVLGGGRNLSPGFQTFTHDHSKMIASTWKREQNKVFTIFNGDGSRVLATETLPMSLAATQPDLSADDTLLAYVVPQAGTIFREGDHHFMGGSLYTSTFDPSTNALGAPVLLLGATGTRNYYYPVIAPDRSFVAFNDAPDGGSFYNRNARVKLLHLPGQAGAQPIDLPALNVADGLTNSWPRFSPFVQTYKGKRILWITFSSNRDYGLRLVNTGFDNCYPPKSPSYSQPQPLRTPGVGYEDCAKPQIWMGAVVVDPDPALDAGDRSFPAFWLPFQSVDSHNHAAQWAERSQGMSPDAGGCGEAGASCGGAGGLCCADMVCCFNICASDCVL
jgi:hypothetical protein